MALEQARPDPAHGRHSKGALRRLASVAVFSMPVLTACVVPQTDIEGKDKADVLLAGRLSWNLLDRAHGTEKPAGEAAKAQGPARYNFKLSLDLDASKGNGEFTQHVDFPNQVSLGGPPILGPADVAVDFSLFRSSAVVRAANRFESGFGVDGFLGLGLSDLDIRVETAVQSDSDSYAAYGPLIGATLSYWVFAPLRIYAEGSAHLGFGSNYSTATVTSRDLGAALRLGDYAECTAGWRQLHYEAEFGDGTRSDLDLQLSGPLIALWLNF